MSYKTKEHSFPSSDGIHSIHAEIYFPETDAYRGVVQISHGMIDHIGRYGNLVEHLTAQGFVVAGNDHLGHGGSVNSPDEYGFFADKGGAELVISDIRRMNEYLHAEFPQLPLVLLGHSMGSFIARIYAAMYPDTVDALIIHGTGGPNRLLPVGHAAAAVLSLFRGKHYRSRLVADLAFMGYNSRFPKEEGKLAWLTRAGELVAGKEDDERSNFIFTISAYRDLFRFLGRCNSGRWFKSFPKGLPMLIVSGDMDPVGSFGKGPAYVYRRLIKCGARDVTLKLYEGARHELFNETNREEIFRDISSWLDRSIK